MRVGLCQGRSHVCLGPCSRPRLTNPRLLARLAHPAWASPHSRPQQLGAVLGLAEQGLGHSRGSRGGPGRGGHAPWASPRYGHCLPTLGSAQGPSWCSAGDPTPNEEIRVSGLRERVSDPGGPLGGHDSCSQLVLRLAGPWPPSTPACRFHCSRCSSAVWAAIEPRSFTFLFFLNLEMPLDNKSRLLRNPCAQEAGAHAHRGWGAAPAVAEPCSEGISGCPPPTSLPAWPSWELAVLGFFALTSSRSLDVPRPVAAAVALGSTGQVGVWFSDGIASQGQGRESQLLPIRELAQKSGSTCLACPCVSSLWVTVGGEGNQLGAPLTFPGGAASCQWGQSRSSSAWKPQSLLTPVYWLWTR